MLAYGHVEMEKKWIQKCWTIMAAHGHVEMEVRMFKTMVAHGHSLKLLKIRMAHGHVMRENRKNTMAK